MKRSVSVFCRLVITVTICLAAGFFYSVSASNGETIMGGEIPLMDGAEIVKESLFNGSGRFELEVDASPEKVANFYKQAMEEKGWPPGMVMSVGNQSVLMLNRQGDQFVLKAESKNGRTRVIITLIRKAQAQEAATEPLPSADTAAPKGISPVPQSETVSQNSGIIIEGSPPTKGSFVKRIIIPAKKDSRVQPNDPGSQPDDPNSNSDEPLNSNEKDIKSDDDSEKIPEMLSVSLFGSVKWDIDEEIKKAWNYKGSVTYQYTGNMKLIQKADRETRPVLIYRPEGMTLSYNFNETFTDYVDECPVQFEHSGGGGSQIDESAELKIIRIGAMAAPYMKNLSADKQQFLTSMQGSIAIPDYYEFYASGPSEGGKMQGRTRFTGACDSYKPTKKSLSGLGGMVQMKIPKSGTMEGSRSWSADYQGTYPPSLNFFISDVASFLGKSPLSPPVGGKKNVNYSVSWKIGETALSPITATADEDDEDKEKNCEELQKRIDFIKIIRKTYADQSLRDNIKETGGTHEDYQEAVEKRVMEETHSGNGAPGKAKTLMETVPFYDSKECTNISKIEIRGTVEGTTKTLLLYDAMGNQVDDTEDFWKLQQDWEEFYGEEAGQCLFKAAVRHEECHVKQFVKQGKIKSIDDRAERELEAFQIEQENLEQDFTDMDC